MKRLTLFLGCLVTVLSCSTLSAQTPSQDEMMKVWQAYMTPGDVHKMLAKYDGEWKTEMTMWMDPTSAPTKSTGKVTNKMILGGRYQETRYSGDFMNMPMEGIGMTGYDNAKKVFITTWVDNMGTGMMLMEGTWDDSKKTINFSGKTVDPATGKDIMVKEVIKFIDDKTQQMEMYMVQDGTEFKTMQIIYTRI
jgi:hypothetical protein